MAASLTLLLAAAGEAAAQRPQPRRGCAAEIGQIAARRLAEDCREAAPTTPALCRPETPCDAMRETIAEACRAPGAETIPVCRDQDDDEDDDDEDE